MKKVIAIIATISILFCGCSMASKNEEKTSESTTVTTSENIEPSSEDSSNPTVTGIGVDGANYSANSITWGPGNITNHQRPTDPESLQKKYSKIGGEWLLNDGKEIALTFDEGYENGYTGAILDTLKAANVRAIFFCTYDYVKRNSDLVNRMIKEGHIVGNHSYNHYNLTEISLEKASDEITLMHDYMKNTFNYEMKYFRFPEGEFSEQTLALANSLGYKSVFWSFAYADWDTSNPPNKDTAYKLITSSTHNGAILLLHAVCETNSIILPNVIKDIEKQGYKFTTEL